ncbi:MAG: DUF481 domain-containing protein [Pirellulaceae bacterium]
MTRGLQLLTGMLATLLCLGADAWLSAQEFQYQEPRVEYTIDYAGLEFAIPPLEELLPEEDLPAPEKPRIQLVGHERGWPELPPLPDVPEAKVEELPPAEADKPAEEIVAEVVEEKKEEKPEAVQEEIGLRDYGWLDMVPYGYYAHMDYWLGEAKWNNSLELGINGQTGNTESLSLRGGARLRREGKYTTTSANVRHLRTSNRGIRTQNNAIMDSRFELPFKTFDRWHLFETNFLEFDEFKVFDLRLAVNGGLGYKIIKTDATDFTMSVGSGFSREYGSPNEEMVPEGMMGWTLNQQFTSRHSIEGKYEIFPDWGDFSQYRSVGEFAYKVMLDEDNRLSMKFSVVNRFDSSSNGTEKNDMDYAVLLLWKN